MTLQVKLAGRSGCPIKIVEKGRQIYVYKGSASLSSNERLKKQALMQNAINSNCSVKSKYLPN